MQVDAQSWVALATGGCAAAYVAYCYGYINAVAAAERTAAERKPLPRLGLSSEKLHYEFAKRTSSLEEDEEDAVESDERPGTPSANDVVERPDTPTTANGRRLWCALKPPSHVTLRRCSRLEDCRLAPSLSHGGGGCGGGGGGGRNCVRPARTDPVVPRGTRLEAAFLGATTTRLTSPVQ